MTSTTEPNQRSGGLGDVVPTKQQPKISPVEKWLPCNTPGYVRSSITGIVKQKEDLT